MGPRGSGDCSVLRSCGASARADGAKGSGPPRIAQSRPGTTPPTFGRGRGPRARPSGTYAARIPTPPAFVSMTATGDRVRERQLPDGCRTGVIDSGAGETGRSERADTEWQLASQRVMSSRTVATGSGGWPERVASTTPSPATGVCRRLRWSVRSFGATFAGGNGRIASCSPRSTAATCSSALRHRREQQKIRFKLGGAAGG